MEKRFVLISQYISMYIILLYTADSYQDVSPGWECHTVTQSHCPGGILWSHPVHSCDWDWHCFMSGQTNICTKIVSLRDRKDNWRTNKYLSLQAVSPGVVLTTSGRDSRSQASAAAAPTHLLLNFIFLICQDLPSPISQMKHYKEENEGKG